MSYSINFTPALRILAFEMAKRFKASHFACKKSVLIFHVIEVASHGPVKIKFISNIFAASWTGSFQPSRMLQSSLQARPARLSRAFLVLVALFTGDPQMVLLSPSQFGS
jgi:hypothetical protein